MENDLRKVLGKANFNAKNLNFFLQNLKISKNSFLPKKYCVKYVKFGKKIYEIFV